VVKTNFAGSLPHGQIEADKTYKVRSILDESKTSYKIDWEDDPVTGEKYDPTWEPKANANQAAIDDWVIQQKKKKRKRSSAVPEGMCSAIAYFEVCRSELCESR
jgi:type IV secretory pathway TrbF-like protein